MEKTGSYLYQTYYYNKLIISIFAFVIGDIYISESGKCVKIELIYRMQRLPLHILTPLQLQIMRC